MIEATVNEGAGKGDRMTVIPGQIWEDLDRRFRRQVKVLSVDKNYAYVQADPSGRKSRISLKRMRPIHNGFRLVGGPGISLGKEGA